MILNFIIGIASAPPFPAHSTGLKLELFTEAAIGEIFKFSGGIPRLINKACSETLMYGSQNRKTILDDHMVKLIVEQEMIRGNS